MKKLSNVAQIGIAIVGLGIVYATFAKPGEGGTGGGGGLDIPVIPDLSSFFDATPVSSPTIEPSQALMDDYYQRTIEPTLTKKATFVAPTPTPQSFPGSRGWSTISSYTSGSSGSKKSESISPSGQTAASVVRSYAAGIRRGL